MGMGSGINSLKNCLTISYEVKRDTYHMTQQFDFYTFCLKWLEKYVNKDLFKDS